MQTNIETLPVAPRSPGCTDMRHIKASVGRHVTGLVMSSWAATIAAATFHAWPWTQSNCMSMLQVPAECSSRQDTARAPASGQPAPSARSKCGQLCWQRGAACAGGAPCCGAIAINQGSWLCSCARSGFAGEGSLTGEHTAPAPLPVQYSRESRLGICGTITCSTICVCP